MNPPDPLANLHPLRVPDEIGWWPLAPGWWLLLFAVTVLVAVVAYVLYRRYKRNAYRRLALRQLLALQASYRTQMDPGHYLAQLNALLKSVALLAYPRAEVAAQHGENWRGFLNSSLPPGEQLPAVFSDAAYQKTCPGIDMLQVDRAARLWIRRHRATS